MNMTNSERRSTSVPREINRQGKITPDHVNVASVSLYALIKAKICSSFRPEQNLSRVKFVMLPGHLTPTAVFQRKIKTTYSKPPRIRTYFSRARLKLVPISKVLRLISRYKASYLKGASFNPLESLTKMFSTIICFWKHCYGPNK